MLRVKEIRVKKICFAIMFFFVSTLFCYAQTKTFTIGVEDLKYYPEYENRDGNYIGYARDLFDMFAKESGYKFEYIPRPVKRLFSEYLNKKKFDFKYPDNPYWQKGMKEGINVIYSDSVVKYIDGVMVLSENKGKKIETFKILGTVRGFTPYPWLDLINSKKVSLSENSNNISLLLQAIKKRVDGAYISVSVAKYILINEIKKPASMVFDENLPHIKDSYYLSSINNPEVIKQFNQFLKNKKDDVDKLKRKYGVGLLN